MTVYTHFFFYCMYFEGFLSLEHFTACLLCSLTTRQTLNLPHGSAHDTGWLKAAAHLRDCKTRKLYLALCLCILELLEKLSQVPCGNMCPMFGAICNKVSC